MSRHREQLACWFDFALPEPDVVEAVVDKHLQYQLADEVGMPHAATRYPEDLREVERIKDLVEYPAILKPYYAHLWHQRRETKGVKVSGPEELVQAYRESTRDGLKTMVQSFIPGPNTNHFKVSACIGRDGEPLAVFTLHKIRQWPVDLGVGSMVESVHDPELTGLGLRFFRDIGYRGIGSIEFKRDSRDGVLKMIELNPRLWLQHGLAMSCGVDFPLIQYRDLTGQTPRPVTAYRDGVFWIDTVNDFRAFWSLSGHDAASMRAWLRSAAGAKVHTTFALDDLGPFLVANAYGLRYVKGLRKVARSS